jgi:hypothetical protein
MHATYDGDKRKDEQGGWGLAYIPKLHKILVFSRFGMVDLAYHMATDWQMQG